MIAFLVSVFVLCFPVMAHAESSKPAVVVVPVADVWSRPLAAGEKPTDELRETQVLFGEKVLIHESSGPWVRIEAVEQPEFTHHNKWEGYPGWVLQTTLGDDEPSKNSQLTEKSWEFVPGYRTELPIGARIFEDSMSPELIPPLNVKKILETADLFKGVHYLWGGLTPGNPPLPKTPMDSGLQSAGTTPSQYGVDCSGLTYLAFHVNGVAIPRDAYEQWMKAKPIKRAELKPADLIFSSKIENPKKITHVALYAGNGQIIEAPQGGMVVRKISFKDKYGKPLEAVESGDQVGDRVVYFGSFLH